MTSKFSQRMGITPIQAAIQLESMDVALRNSLWNVLEVIIWENSTHYPLEHHSNSLLLAFARRLWQGYFKATLDEMPDRRSTIHRVVKTYFIECEWYEVYDFIEFTAHNAFRIETPLQGQFISACNRVLEAERSGYRFIAAHIVPISDKTELQAIEEAIQGPWGPVRTHLTRGIELFGARENPDYRNAVKEAISAVEAACKLLANDPHADLNRALAVVNQSHELHPSFREALKKLYGYTSDKDGIRHAILEENEVTLAEAKFMLIVCAAFCNFLALSVPIK